jgi:hypothetical protein
MADTRKVIRKEIERLKNALKKVLKPREAQPQLVWQPVRNPSHPRKMN